MMKGILVLYVNELVDPWNERSHQNNILNIVFTETKENMIEMVPP